MKISEKITKLKRKIVQLNYEIDMLYIKKFDEIHQIKIKEFDEEYQLKINERKAIKIILKFLEENQ